MGKQPGKLVLSTETLRNLDDTDLSGVVGGTGTIVCLNSAVCNSGVCNGVVSQSVVCQISSAVCVGLSPASRRHCAAR